MYVQFARVYLSKEVSRSLFELARQSSKSFKLRIVQTKLLVLETPPQWDILPVTQISLNFQRLV